MISAAKSGAALIQVKASLPHGDFIPWVEANMPVDVRQCQKFMRLAENRPELLEPNANPGSHLDINSEIRLLTTDKDVEETVREVAEEEGLSRAQILSLTKALEAEKQESAAIKQRAEEWRQQYKKERDKARELEAKVKLAKQAEERLRYRLDEEVSRALADEMKSVTAQIEKMEEEKQALKKSLENQRKRQQEAIENGVRTKLKEQQDEINRNKSRG